MWLNVKIKVIIWRIYFDNQKRFEENWKLSNINSARNLKTKQSKNQVNQKTQSTMGCHNSRLVGYAIPIQQRPVIINKIVPPCAPACLPPLPCGGLVGGGLGGFGGLGPFL